MSWKAGRTVGYNADYAEIYAALDDLHHPRHCDGCRPCEVMKATLEWMVQGLSRRLSQEEFYTLASILAKAETRAMEEWQSKSPEKNEGYCRGKGPNSYWKSAISCELPHLLFETAISPPRPRSLPGRSKSRVMKSFPNLFPLNRVAPCSTIPSIIPRNHRQEPP